jgi:hypothetical protein
MTREQLDAAALELTYQEAMAMPLLRERARKRRQRPMAERIMWLATNTLAFAALLWSTTVLRNVPLVGVALEVVAALAAFHQLCRFLLDSVVVYHDVTELESRAGVPVKQEASQDEGRGAATA